MQQKRKKLREEHELLLTSNGKPMAVLLHLDEADDPEQALHSVREARSQLALRKIRKQAANQGIQNLGIEGINNIIRASRSQRKNKP